jgi:serine/threonine protein kinase/ankyrin repeat protein
MIAALVNAYPAAVLAPDATDSLPLHSLLRVGKANTLMQCVQSLLAVEGARQVATVNKSGALPLHFYLRRRTGRTNPALMELLLPRACFPSDGGASASSFPSSSSSSSSSSSVSKLLGWASVLKQERSVVRRRHPATPLSVEEQRMLLAAQPKPYAPEDVRALLRSKYLTPTSFAILMQQQAEFKWPLSHFHMLLSARNLTLDMVRELLSAFPVAAGTKNPSEWRSGWGTAKGSALAALLRNRSAMRSTDFLAMVDLLLERTPAEIAQFHPNAAAVSASADAIAKQQQSGETSAAKVAATASSSSALSSSLSAGSSSSTLAPPLLNLVCNLAANAREHCSTREFALFPELLSVPFVELLQKHLPEVLTLTDANLGRIPLHHVCGAATGKLDSALIPWLVANTPREVLSLRDKEHATPLHIALVQRELNKTVVQHLLQTEPALARDTLHESGEFPLHELSGRAVMTSRCCSCSTTPTQRPAVPSQRTGRACCTTCASIARSQLVSAGELRWIASKPELRAQFQALHNGRTALMALCRGSLVLPVLDAMLDQLGDGIGSDVACRASEFREEHQTALHMLAARAAEPEHEAVLATMVRRYPSLASTPVKGWLPLHELASNSDASASMFLTLLRAHPAALHTPSPASDTVLGLLWRGVRTRRLLDARDLARLCSVTLALVELDVTVLRQLPSLPQLVCAHASDSDLRVKVSELLVGLIDALGKPAVAKTTLVSQLLPPSQAAECWHALLLCAKKGASFAQLLPTFQTLLGLMPSLISHMSARANALEVCQLLVEKGASLLTADKKGLTAVQHAPVLSHGPVHAFLVERQRLASMYRGRFEIDHTRAPLVSAHGKVKFAFEAIKDHNITSDGSTPFPTAIKISVSPPSSGTSTSAAAASSSRLRVVLKFADNAAEFASERRIYEQIGDSAGGQYLPRLLAVFEPLPTAPAGSDDAMWCLALEGGTENLRAKMVRKGSSGFPTMDMLPVASSALAALRFLHRRGLVHGDIKPENLVAFADDYRLIDFDAARQVDAPLSLAFTAHYTPPEQAKRVLAARQAEREGKVLSVPKLLADGSYDVWCLGTVLFEMRAGRTLFGNSSSNSTASSLTGDKERDVDAILASICAATDESIAASIDALKDSSGLNGNGIEHPLRENEASFLKKMLRVRVGESKSSCRFSVRDLVVVLQEEILNGMTSTQQTRSWEAKLQGINDTVVATHTDVRLANSKLSAMDQQQQKAEQHLRQIKAGVHMVAVRVDEVGVAVAEVLKGQEGMNVSLGEILTLCNKLEEQAQQTLRAVFDVHESCDMPRLFSLLPDQLDAARKPMAPAEWRSLKERFSHALGRREPTSAAGREGRHALPLFPSDLYLRGGRSWRRMHGACGLCRQAAHAVDAAAHAPGTQGGQHIAQSRGDRGQGGRIPFASRRTPLCRRCQGCSPVEQPR